GIALAGLYCVGASSLHASAPAMWVQLGALAAVLLLPVVPVLRRSGGVSIARTAVPAPASVAPEGIGALVICYGALGFGYILPATFLPVMARSIVEDPRIFG